MKHIKKYRKLLTKKQQERMRSTSRQSAKQILAIRYKEEYDKLKGYYYRRLRRELFK